MRSNTSTQAVLEQFTYGYDKAGNRTSVTTDTTTINYPANESNQTTAEQGFGATTFSGTLDEPALVTVNSQPAKVMSDGGSAPYTFEALIDLAEGDNTVTIEATDGNNNVATQSYSVNVGGITKTLEYDLNGNLRYEKDTSGTVLREFQWDAKNRLVKLIDGTHETEFVYDGFDRRVRIIELENSIEQSNKVYLWDGTQIAQRRDSTAATIERSYFNQGFEESGNDYYYTKDHLGSIREVVASDGTSVESIYDYSPWGEVTKVSGTGVESDFLYTGHFYQDESDLHLTLYRAYNPELGMWLSRDPYARVTGEIAELLSDGTNLYSYVSNNPTRLVDPNGLWGIDPNSRKHTHRNENNRCPSKEPEYKKGRRNNGNSYKDCEGGKWNKDPDWSANKYHGGFNTYRGNGRNKGSQCVYDEAGRLIDSGPSMGTYDYSKPATSAHYINDVVPHNENPNYEPNLTEQFGCN